MGAFTSIRQTINTWGDVNVTLGTAKVASNASTYSSARTLGIALLIACVLLGLGIAFAVSRSIKR